MTKSKVAGVYFSQGLWIARTPGKRYLYRGSSMTDAETARLEFDETNYHQPQAKPRKKRKTHNGAFQPVWPAS